MNERERQIDRVMRNMPREWRYHWCQRHSHACACCGCADMAGGAAKSMTYEEWQDWVEAHPDPGPEEDSDPILEREEQELIHCGYKVAATKRIMARKGIGLKEARQLVTEYLAEAPEWRFRKRKGGLP